MSIPFIVYINVTVEAESENEAIEKTEEVRLSSFMGNGGKGDKMVGVSAPNMTVEASDEPHIMGFYEVEATKVD